MENKNIQSPHVLIIPPWFDIDFSGYHAKMFHQFASDIQQYTPFNAGILYGEFQWRYLKRMTITYSDIPYFYLGQRDFAFPKKGIFWRYWIRKYLRLFEIYTLKFGLPNLLHGHSILGLVAAGAISKKYNIPLIYTEHLGRFLNDSVPQRQLNWAKKWIDQTNFNSAASPLFAQKLKEVFGSEFHHMPNYIDTEFFLPKAQPATPPIFISIGAPAYTKGIDQLLKAFQIVVKHIPQAQLILVDKLTEVLPVINRLDLKGKVIMTGEVDRISIRDLLHSSSILVSASRMESFGMSMIEALACGRPVVATQTAGSSFIVTPELGEIVPQNDVNALAKAMVSMAKNLPNYEPNTLHQRIRQRFSKEMLITLWEEVYYNILNSK